MDSNLATSTVVLKSTCATGAGFNPAPVVIDEQRVVGSRCGPFEAALELLSSGGIDVESYISGAMTHRGLELRPWVIVGALFTNNQVLLCSG